MHVARVAFAIGPWKLQSLLVTKPSQLLEESLPMALHKTFLMRTHFVRGSNGLQQAQTRLFLSQTMIVCSHRKAGCFAIGLRKAA